MSYERGIRVDLGKSFTVAPLITQQDGQPRIAILLANRDHARVSLLKTGEISDGGDLLAFSTGKVRMAGARKSSHIERSKEDLRKHFSSIGSQLLGSHQRGGFEGLVVGCRDDLWPEIEAGFPSDLKRIVLGRFCADAGADTPQEVHEIAEKVIARHDRNELREVATKAVEEAGANRLGAMGLADVVQALERNEVRVLLLPDPRARLNVAARLCPRCGHLDLESGNTCPLCSAAMRRYPRADEALVRKAMAGGTEIRSLRHTSAHPEDEIGAWLRFRAERIVPRALAS